MSQQNNDFVESNQGLFSQLKSFAKKKPSGKKSSDKKRAATQSLETLEGRQMFSFGNKWVLISPAIAKVPFTAGSLSSVTVKQGATTLYSGQLNLRNTLNRIRNNKSVNQIGDGSLYNDTASKLPAGHGTWFEFFVDPKSGTDHNFGNIKLPGPMRVVLATDGDTFFSGDSDTTFTNVFTPAVVVAPTIGTFTISPNSVTRGQNTTFTADNVTVASGTVSSVRFYLEVNGVAGLQDSFDLLLGSATKSGTTWTLDVPTDPIGSGTFTAYAVAYSSTGGASVPSTATLTVAPNVSTTPTPSIGSFFSSASGIVAGIPVTLTAANVFESGGKIANVKFYRESNSAEGLQPSGDTLLGTGTPVGTTNWTILAGTGGFTDSQIYYAVATDVNGVSSAPLMTSVVVINPTVIGSDVNWNVAGQTSFGTQGFKAITAASGITNTTGLTRGSGVTMAGTAVSGAWGGTGWGASSADGITSNATVTFGITLGNVTSSLSSITMNYLRTSTGPTSALWQYQKSGGTWTTLGDFSNQFSDTSTTGAAISPISLSGIAGLQNLAGGTTVNFRIIPYGATDSTGQWYIKNIDGMDLTINGSVFTPPAGLFKPISGLPILGNKTTTTTTKPTTTATTPTSPLFGTRSA